MLPAPRVRDRTKQPPAASPFELAPLHELVGFLRVDTGIAVKVVIGLFAHGRRRQVFFGQVALKYFTRAVAAKSLFRL